MTISKEKFFFFYFFLRAAYRLAGSFNMRGRLRQLFHVLTDDNVGSGPRPEPNSLQDPPTVQPQAELVEEAVERIQQDHMYISQQRSSQSTSKTAPGSGSKRKSDDTSTKSGNKQKR
jgi:hypothetical protein